MGIALFHCGAVDRLPADVYCVVNNSDRDGIRMLEKHHELDERFRLLMESRRGPVFFLEHGIPESEVGIIAQKVRHDIATKHIESNWWDSNYLPLLVTATEVGYGYRGTGTDFWPILEKELDTEFNSSSR